MTTRARDALVPLFEALNWAVSIDLTLEEAGTPLENDPLSAVRFARNRVHHQWATAFRRFDVPPPPMVVTATGRRGAGATIIHGGGFWWHWIKAAELPVGRADPGRERLYKDLLEDKPAATTLIDLRPVLAPFK
jgi:hypothetical protein